MRSAWACCLVLLMACGDDGVGPGDTPDASASVAASVQIQDGIVGEAAPEDVAVLVTDEAGSPLSGVPVTWVVTAGAGSITGETATRADGIARATWTLGTAVGTNTVEARVQSLPAVSFSATALAGPPAALSLDPATIAFDIPGDSARLTAIVEDQYGNPLPTGVVSWSSSLASVLSVDDAGWVRVVGGGTATIEASADGFTASAAGVVDMPRFTVPFIDLDVAIDFSAFGAPISAVHDNVAYEIMTDDDSMEVRSVSSGVVERVFYQADTDDYELFVQFGENWLVLYDHLVDPRLAVGDDVQPGDILGLVAYFGTVQEGMDLVPAGRIELQVNYVPSGLAWCPALFGSADFNAAHDEAIARTNPEEAATCRKPTAQP